MREGVWGKALYWEWTELQSPSEHCWCDVLRWVQLMSSANIFTWQKFAEIHIIQKATALPTHRICVAPQYSVDIYRHFQLRQNRMTGNSNFQFESNSSSTSDYLIFSTKPSKICCYGMVVVAVIVVVVVFYLFSFFCIWEKGKEPKQRANPWVEQKKCEEWMNFEETKPKLILDIGQFEKCFQSIYVYKWVGPGYV